MINRMPLISQSKTHHGSTAWWLETRAAKYYCRCCSHLLEPTEREVITLKHKRLDNRSPYSCSASLGNPLLCHMMVNVEITPTTLWQTWLNFKQEETKESPHDPRSPRFVSFVTYPPVNTSITQSIVAKLFTSSVIPIHFFWKLERPLQLALNPKKTREKRVESKQSKVQSDNKIDEADSTRTRRPIPKQSSVDSVRFYFFLVDLMGVVQVPFVKLSHMPCNIPGDPGFCSA